MRFPALALLALLLALPLAGARPVAFDLEATRDGFRLRGSDESPPVLEVEAGDEVTLRFANRAAASHNVHFGAPVNASTPCCQRPNESFELAFTVPAGALGGVPFWSDADPDGYRGVLLVGQPRPRVLIREPAEGADVNASFSVRVEVVNFPLGGEGGRVRYLVDGRNVSTLTDQTTFPLENLPLGHHLVRAELVDRDGSPLDPPAFDEVLVYRVAPPTPLPQSNATTTPPAETTPTPWPGVLAALAALAIASRSRRPRR